MGSDVSRTVAMQSQSGGRKIRLNINSAYAEYYQKSSMEDITSCLLRRDREFGRYKMALNSEEFRKVFEGVVANPMDLFSLFDTRNKDLICSRLVNEATDPNEEVHPLEALAVDVSEVFASAFLFAAGKSKGLDEKLDKIFSLFDFDGNGGLGEVEAEIMLECVVRGTSRVAMMPQPEDVLESTEKLTANLFAHSKRQAGAWDLTLRDLKDWISEREDVAAFLYNFTDARMIISSLELVEKNVALGMSLCKQDHSGAEQAGSMVDGARAGEILRSLAIVGKTTCLKAGVEDVTDADAAAIVRMLVGNSGSSAGRDGKGERVHVAALEELLRFWVAFSVVDEDGLGTVSVADLKALLWLSGGTGGEEPPEATVQKTANDIDESQDGVIERMEWMRYTAVLDEGSGTVGYDGGLLTVFRRYDDDHSGSISANEMIMMVRDSVMDAVAEAPESLCFKPGMETVVDTLFKDVAKDLVNQLDVAGTGTLGWTDFKKNQTLVTTRLATLREYVFSVALQRREASLTEARSGSSSSSSRRSSSGSSSSGSSSPKPDGTRLKREEDKTAEKRRSPLPPSSPDGREEADFRSGGGGSSQHGVTMNRLNDSDNSSIRKTVVAL